MKKTICYLFTLLFLSDYIIAQPASGTWPLSSSTTVNATGSGSVTASSEVIGSYFTGNITYGTGPVSQRWWYPHYNRISIC